MVGTLVERDSHMDEIEARALHGLVGTSGRPMTPPLRPSPEATYDLAWRYGRDLARLDLVDPRKILFFWEVTDATAARGAGRPGSLGVRLEALGPGSARRTVHESANVTAVMNWYFEVEPLHRYRASVGWRSPSGELEPWLVSNELETPRLLPNVTAQVTWRAGGRRGRAAVAAPAPRGGGLGLFEATEAARRALASVGGVGLAASSVAARLGSFPAEMETRLPGSGTLTGWSRSSIPSSTSLIAPPPPSPESGS